MIEGNTTAYDLFERIPVETAQSLQPGTSLLITGSPMVGTDDFVVDLLADGARRGEGVVAVTTADSGPAAVATVTDRAPETDPRRIVAVDARSGGRIEDSESSADTGATVYHADAPSDMTGIGIGITNGFERLGEIGVQRGRLGLVSLSTMLTYSDREAVFKFCHALSSRLDSIGYVGLFAIDAAAHDDQTLQVLKQAFDGVLKLRERDGTREIRLGGVEPTPSEWVMLEN
jgi:RecA-superfamily ATPases implicated in signal transduction